MKEVIVAALGMAGLFFSLSGATGIVRMPDVYCRIQCSSKNVTMGSLPVLIAVVVAKGLITPFTSRVMLVAFLLLVINPVASHALARAAYRMGVPMWPGAVADVPRQRGQDERPAEARL